MSIFEEFEEFRKAKGSGKSFKRFTEEARQTVVFAQSLEAETIGPLELIVAARQVQLGRRAEKDGLALRYKPFTATGKQSLERSLRLAIEANDGEITSQHILDAALEIVGERNEATG